jgi:hypothetical protein
LFGASAAHGQFDNRWVNFEAHPGFLSTGMISDIDNEVDFAWDDLDKNGFIDLVVVRKEPFTTPGKRSNKLLMNMDGVLFDATISHATASDVSGDFGFRTATNDRDVVIVDVDQDGWLDVVTATTISDGDPKELGHPRVYMNLGEDGNGDWLGLRYEQARIPQLRHFVSGDPKNPRFCGMAAGDVTGDGFPDLYFADYDSGVIDNFELPEDDLNDRLLVNDGNGFFADETQQRLSGQMALSNFAVSASIVDINLDGAADILKDTALGPYYVSAAYNDPANEGQFNLFDPFHDGLNSYHHDTGDLNNDGRPDVVVSQDNTDRYRYNLSNDPLGRVIWGPAKTFTFLQGEDDGFASNNLIADLDSDGWNDVLICDVDTDVPGYNGRIHIYHNPGGTPGEQITLLEERETAGGGGWLGAAGLYQGDLSGVHDVAVFDIDNDGDNDLILGRKDGTFAWRNTMFGGAWENLETGLPGTHGIPLLVGKGPLSADSPIGIELSGALSGATSWLVVGFNELNAPFFGGTLVPNINPPGFAIPIPTPASGEISIADTWPAGIPSGFSMYLHYWIEDPAGIFGFAASNAVKGTTP